MEEFFNLAMWQILPTSMGDIVNAGLSNKQFLRRLREVHCTGDIYPSRIPEQISYLNLVVTACLFDCWQNN